MKPATRVVPQFSEIGPKCPGSTADIEQLLDHGVDVHFEPQNVRCSLLELEIVRAPRPQLVHLLLSRGVPTHEVEHFCPGSVESGHFEIAELLL